MTALDFAPLLAPGLPPQALKGLIVEMVEIRDFLAGQLRLEDQRPAE